MSKKSSISQPMRGFGDYSAVKVLTDIVELAVNILQRSDSLRVRPVFAS